jgi:tetratricopeptide (TPR) repeat protein
MGGASKAEDTDEAMKQAGDKPLSPARFSAHIFLIVLLGFLAYLNTFDVPLQWDDKLTYISENPIVKDLKYFQSPSLAKEFKQYGAFKSRYIGYLSFALNYRLHGLEVAGYHAVNLALHVMNAAVLYLLVTLTFRTPLMRGSRLVKHSGHIALFTGLIFVSHPVQTEAVTYIFQRLASLAAFFCMLSITAYAGSRLSGRGGVGYALYAVAFVSAVLAMKTKENAFTMPLVMVLYEILFFGGAAIQAGARARRERDTGLNAGARFALLLPLLLTMLIIPITFTGMDMPAGEIISGIESAERGYEKITRGEYLLTQFRVIVTYIRLLILPVSQNIDYDYQVYHSFLNPQVFLSFFYILCLFSTAVYICFWPVSNVEPALKLTAFGVLWFFVTIAVESGVIPIPMLINEYRLYLPSAGAFLAAVTGATILLGRIADTKARAAATAVLMIIPLVLCYAAYSRNSVWESEISLWEDTEGKSPGKARVQINLGVAYMSEGLVGRARERFHSALRLYPVNAEAHNNLGVTYASEGFISNAIEHFQLAQVIDSDFGEAYVNLGRAYNLVGWFDDAIEQCEKALSLLPDNPTAHYNLGIAFREKGHFKKAEEHFLKAYEKSE